MADTNYCVLIWIYIFCTFISTFASTESIISSAGETAVLICPRSTNINLTFWTGPPGFSTYNFPGSIDITSTLPNANRLQINASNAALLIHNATLDDQGLYRCSTGASGRTDIELIITNVPPTITMIDNAERIENREIIRGTEDQSLTLNCSTAAAKPEANITWWRMDSNESFATENYVQQYPNGTFLSFATLTLRANRSLDRLLFRCEVCHPALESPTQVDIEIYLNLKPQLKPLAAVTVVTDGETTVVRCEATGCRPEANLTLLFEDTVIQDEHSNAVFNDSSETYSIMTQMTKTVGKRDNGKVVVCVVSHLALSAAINTSGMFVVQYPPVVVVTGSNTSVNSLTTTLLCTAANGNPDRYVFAPWQHTWPGYSGIIRQETAVESERQSTLTFQQISYQDSGIYKCGANNNISKPGHPILWAYDEVALNIKDIPQVVSGQSRYSVDPDEEVQIILEVYSNVEPIDVSLTRKPSNETTTAFWSIYKTSAIIRLPVYNQRVSETGYRISVTLDLRSTGNYGDYSIAIRNAIGAAVHDVTILPRESSTQSSAIDTADDTIQLNNLIPIIAGSAAAVVVCVTITIVIVCCCKRNQNSKEGNGERRHTRRNPVLHRRPAGPVSEFPNAEFYDTIEDLTQGNVYSDKAVAKGIPSRGDGQYVIRGNVTVNYYITPARHQEMEGYLRPTPRTSIDKGGPIIEEVIIEETNTPAHGNGEETVVEGVSEQSATTSENGAVITEMSEPIRQPVGKEDSVNEDVAGSYITVTAK